MVLQNYSHANSYTDVKHESNTVCGFRNQSVFSGLHEPQPVFYSDETGTSEVQKLSMQLVH
jgi:hypothetical protein